MVTRGWAALVGLALLAAPAGAGAQEVSANVEPRLVPVGGVAELTIEVDPGGARERVDEPSLPALPAHVSVVGRARESRVEMRGLDVRRTVVFRYSLRGLEPGTVRIEPVSVRIGDTIRRTEPLVLLVVGESGLPGVAAGGAPPIFVSARVDRERAWIGQQVTLTFAFYHDPAIPLSESPDYDPPETPGFWRVELSAAPEISSERVGGRTYQVQRFRYALFPLQAGTSEIGSARVRVVQPDPERWWEPGGARVLATDPLTVTIDELPAGAPPGFDGAVGRYSLSGGLPAGRATAGSPFELSVTVRGSGNTATVDAPELPDWPGIEVGAPSVETEPEIDGTRLGGRATFRWILVPRSEGRWALGEARLPYFDPDAGAYAVDTLRLGELHVSPGSLAAGQPPPESPREPTLWDARAPREPWPRGLARSPLLWGALAGPWLAGLAVAVWNRRPRAQRPARGAEAVAVVSGARRELEARGSSGAPAAGIALERALALRFGGGHAGLPASERRERLARAGASVEIVEAAEAARTALEAIRFGGIGVERAAAQLERLEIALRQEDRGPAVGSGGGWAGALLVVAALGAGVTAETAVAQDPSAIWNEANRALRAGDVAAAVRGYEALSERFDDARIEANLAAAHWRAGRRGEALAGYRAALLLEPRNAAIRRDATRLWTELGRPPRDGALARALAHARLDELLLALLVANAMAAAAVLAARRRPARAPLSVAACATTVLLAGAAALHAWTIERPERAVAAAGAELEAAPGGASIAALPEGSVVEVLERADAASRVKATGLPAGWVAADRIVPLD